VSLWAVFGGDDGRPASVAEPEVVVPESSRPTEADPPADLRTVMRTPPPSAASSSSLPLVGGHVTTDALATAAEETVPEAHVDPFAVTRENFEELAHENWGFLALVTAEEMRSLIAEEADWRRTEVFVEPRWLAGVPGSTMLGDAAGDFVEWDESPTLRAVFAEFQSVRRQREARHGPESTDTEGIRQDGEYIRDVLGPRVVDSSGLGARHLYDLAESFRYLDLLEETK
jgi:hypothetical protein